MSFFSGLFGSDKTTWLRQDGSERIFTLHLGGVNNPLDPDPIWEHEFGGDTDITDTVSGSTERRLKDALDMHRRTSYLKKKDSGFGFPVPHMLVYSDVVIWIPKKHWQNASRNNTNLLYIMTAKLEHHHQEYFGEVLYRNRKPHYSIMPHAELNDNEVMCQFGLGVFLPDKEDKQVMEILLRKAGEKPRALPQWKFYEADNDGDSHEVTRPSGLYEKQLHLLIAQSKDEAAIRSALWFKDNPNGYLMLDTSKKPEKIYGDDAHIHAGKISVRGDSIYCPFASVSNPNEQLSLTLRPVGEIPVEEEYPAAENDFAFSYHTQKGHTADFVDIKAEDINYQSEHDAPVSPKGEYIYASFDESEVKAIPSLPSPNTTVKKPSTATSLNDTTAPKVTSQSTSQSRPSPTDSNTFISLDDWDENNDSHALSGLTFINEDDIEPDYRYSLALTGIILPRIANMQRLGLRYWIIHLRQDGMPAAEDEKTYYCIRGHQNHALQWTTVDQEPFVTEDLNWQSLSLETKLPFLATKTQTLEPPLIKKRQYGLYPLPQVVAFPLSDQMSIVGRDKNPDKPYDIAVRLLTREDSMVFKNKNRRVNLAQLNFASDHLSVQLENEQLSIQQKSDKVPSYILNEKGQLRDTLHPKTQAQDSLSENESVILGNFRLSFIKEDLRLQKA